MNNYRRSIDWDAPVTRDPDDTYDESTNPGNGWRAPDPEPKPKPKRVRRVASDYGFKCMECGRRVRSRTCSNCGSTDIDLA